MDIYIYTHVYIHVYTGTAFRAESGPARGIGLLQHSQSLTMPVEDRYFQETLMRSPIWDFPPQRPEHTHLPLAQSFSDCASEFFCPLQGLTTP